LIERI